MVKIKYNNMKTRSKAIPNPVQVRRCTLRSAHKPSPLDNAITGGSSDEKALQQIQKQFDNQQSINASKSTGPILEDLKPALIEPATFSMRTRRTRFLDLPKPQPQEVIQQAVTKESLEEVKLVVQTPPIEEIKEQQKPQELLQEMFMTPVKPESRISKADESQGCPILKASRRSHRNCKRNSITQVPFRKFQDSFEHKIILLINRVFQRKSNEKDIEQFIDKVHKMSNKEMFNPYVVSGIQTILNLMQRSKHWHITTIPKLKSEVTKLSAKIWQELGKTDDYEGVQVQQKGFDFEGIRPRFIKKIYRMLLETNLYGFGEAREKSFRVEQAFFAEERNYVNEDGLLAFFREQKFLQC